MAWGQSSSRAQAAHHGAHKAKALTAEWTGGTDNGSSNRRQG